MQREEVLSKVNEIFQDAFNKEDLSISLKTTADDVDGWDSLMQMNLIKMIEDEFGIRFTIEEAVEMENVGAMVDIIMVRI